MTHDNFDDLPDDAVRSYNAPPPTPREQMWDAIARARDEASVIPIGSRLATRRAQRWLISAVGIAAVLMIGIAIGRTTRQPATSASVATHTPQIALPKTPRDTAAENAATQQVASSEAATPEATSHATVAHGTRVGTPSRGSRTLDVSGDEGAYRLAVVEHLTRTEVLLTGFHAQARSGSEAKMDAQFASASRDLLGTTRLLLARRGTDPVLTRLLEDLELVLMQLSQYANDGRRADFDAVNQSIEKRNVLPKLRSTIPAGMSAGT